MNSAQELAVEVSRVIGPEECRLQDAVQRCRLGDPIRPDVRTYRSRFT